MRPVVVAAGGTGGHVVPALAVADVLATRDVPVIWLGTKRGLEADLVPAAGIDIRWIDASGLRGKGVAGMAAGVGNVLKALFQSVQLLRELKPRAVLGMGGFVSGPVGLAALLMRKPLVLHEQNAIAGMTNRWLSRFATRVFAAWPEVFKASVTAVTVGNPVRRDMAELAAKRRAAIGNRGDVAAPLSLLIVGGSRGARVLNETVPACIALLGEPVQVHHQCGKGNQSAVEANYQSALDRPSSPGHQVSVHEFIHDMTARYQSADLVICRAGAMTVTELGALGVPSVLVPFPYAVDDHQTRNARHLADAGAAVLLPEAQLTAQSLAATITKLQADRSSLNNMAVAALGCFQPAAAERVADALMEVSN